jgi:hypothetical protein
MDISAIVQGVFDEFDRNKGPKSVVFENHIYGLLVIHQDLSGETFSDIRDIWTKVGIEYGFYENEKAVYEGSVEYRDMWTRLFQDVSCCQPEFVEALGDALFGPLCLRGAVFFASALNTGELPTSLASYADSLFLEPKLEPKLEPEPEQRQEQVVAINVEPVHQEEAKQDVLPANIPIKESVPPITTPIKEVGATIRYRFTRGRVRSPIVGQRKFSRTRKAAARAVL